MAQILHEHSAPARAKLFESQPLHTKYDALRAVLSRRGLRDLLAYFAVPNVDHSGNQIVWSTPFATTIQPVPLSKLSPADRSAVLGNVQRLHDDLCLAEHQISDVGEGRLLRSLLRSLQDVPDERHIYSVDGKPVFVYWSHEQEHPIPDVEYPRLERIDQRRQLGRQPPEQAEQPRVDPGAPPGGRETTKVVERDVVVARGILVFVGGVSFFGTALASVCLAAVAIFYLISGDHWPTTAPIVSVVEGQSR